MKNIKSVICWMAVLLMALSLIPADAGAIPAFARRYKLSCSTCHSPIPRLKAFGAEFAGNGFILKEEEKPRDYISGGDDLLWLNRTFPVAVRFDAYALFDEKQAVTRDLQIPWGLKLLSGGTLYKNIGYYFYFYMSERGEVAGIEDAYVHFDNIFGIPLDVMVGQFQTSDPLMKRELRLTFEDYMIYKTAVGGSGIDLTYDRGVMLVYGIEKTGTDLVGFVVNGNGKAAADEATKKFDKDRFKNYGVRLNQSMGDVFRIGGYYYQGKEKDATTGLNNTVSYWGPDFTISAGLVELTVQYLERKDSDPTFVQGPEIRTKGAVVEVILAPKLDRSRFYLTGLFNYVESDMPEFNYKTATLSGTYLVARNLRLVAEFTRDLHKDVNRFVLGTVTGF